MQLRPVYSRAIHGKGFSLVELVVTLIVVGIVSAYVIPRFKGTHGFEERGFYDETIATVRYAQKTAIASRRMTCVVFTEKTISIRIASSNPAASPTCNNGADLDVSRPDSSETYEVAATATSAYRNADVKFSPVPAAITFDPTGRPNAAASIRIQNFASAITVEAETGYVH